MLTLIIPIGGPGAGKTTLGQNLTPILGDNSSSVLVTSRDKLYAETKQKYPNWGNRKVRRYLYDLFVEFRTEVADRRTRGEDLVVYLDSTNAESGGRKYLVEEFNPDKLILINMKKGKEELLERVRDRTGHPTFPADAAKQEEIMDKIMANLEYAEEGEIIGDLEVEIMNI